MKAPVYRPTRARRFSRSSARLKRANPTSITPSDWGSHSRSLPSRRMAAPSAWTTGSRTEVCSGLRFRHDADRVCQLLLRKWLDQHVLGAKLLRDFEIRLT